MSTSGPFDVAFGRWNNKSMKVIKIGAKWCSGCLVMAPRWREIEAEHPWLMTEYYDFDDNTQEVAKYNAHSEVLPLFIFLKRNGEEILRMHGEVAKDRLVSVIIQNKEN